jgi:hypothetical protein
LKTLGKIAALASTAEIEIPDYFIRGHDTASFLGKHHR